MGERSYQKGTTVSTDGVTVHQLLTEEEFGVPAVVLKLVSNRDRPTTVRLSVTDLQVDRIGFHPEFEDDAWSVTDDRLVFERELDPNAELMTLFAVEDDDVDVLETAIESLDIEGVEPVEAAPEAATEIPADGDGTDDAGSDPIGDVTLDEGIDDELDIDEETPVETAEPIDADADDPDETLIDLEDDGAGLEDPAGAETTLGTPADDEDVAFEAMGSDDSDPLEDAKPANSAATEDDEHTMNEPASEPTAGTLDGASTDALVDELLERIQNEGLTASERRRLEAAGIGDDDGQSEVHEAQIAHLQSRVSDIETFTESIEELFEHHGPPVDVYDDFDDRLAGLEREFDDLRGEVESALEQVDGVEPRLEAVEATMDDVDGELSTVREDLEDVEAGQEEMEADLREIQTWRKKVTGALEAFMGE